MKIKTLLILVALGAFSLTSFRGVHSSKVERQDNGNIALKGIQMSQEDWSTIEAMAAGGFIFSRTATRKKDVDKVDAELVSTTQLDPKEELELASVHKINSILAKYE
ncbi:MAG: hypothetical protein LAT68_11245 [Cyclobacteriaceae bacterium]|nr:hypothetical protein [Cyclobacteriaceae bacterium]MCH8516891.1 hypothetical protein [Cyclobacteriaceae bacterium]